MFWSLMMQKSLKVPLSSTLHEIQEWPNWQDTLTEAVITGLLKGWWIPFVSGLRQAFSAEEYMADAAVWSHAFTVFSFEM